MTQPDTSLLQSALTITTRMDREGILHSLAETSIQVTGTPIAHVGVLDGLGHVTNILTSGDNAGLPEIDEKALRNFLETISITDTEVRKLSPTDALFLEPLSSPGKIVQTEEQDNETEGPAEHATNDTPHNVTHNTEENTADATDNLGDAEFSSFNNAPFLISDIHTKQRSIARLMLVGKETYSHEDEQAVRLLTQASATALENAALYFESISRARWITASRSIITALLEGCDEEDSLQLIADTMRRVSQSDIALIILPSVGDNWICEFTSGKDSHKFVGLEFPPNSRAREAANAAMGRVLEDFASATLLDDPRVKNFGPVLFAPMVGKGKSQGLIMLVRNRYSKEFDLTDLSMAENVATQAVLALELASSRQLQTRALQLEDRSRISRDLHDFAIQKLFASGLKLSTLRDDLSAKHPDPLVMKTLDEALSSIDDSVGQIRSIIYSLRDPEATVPIAQRVTREVSSMTGLLGFTAHLNLEFMGEKIDECAGTEVDDVIGSDLSDDIVAVIREGLTNATKYAHATEMFVSVVITPGHVKVTVKDNGVGMHNVNRRSGLSNLAARARRSHGHFTAHSIEPSGTQLTWEANFR